MNLEPEFIGREAISNRNCKVNSAASMFFFVCVCLPMCLCRPVLSVMTDSVTTICFVTNDNSTHYIFFSFCITIALLFKVLLLRYLCCAL